MTTPPFAPDTLNPDAYEAWLERAAIMEYDGKLSRAKAERLAWACLFRSENP